MENQNKYSSELPQDLLHLLMKRVVTSLEEMIRYGSVCRAWRAAVLTLAKECPSTSPFLLMQKTGSRDFTLFSPSERRYYKLKKMDNGRCIVGSSHGWLGAYDKWDPMKKVGLMNPLTGDRVSLPPLSSISPHGMEFEWDSLQFRKIVWSSCPTSSRCTAMAIFEDSRKVAIAKPGDRQWQLVRVTCAYLNYMVDVVHFNDVFYVINNCGLIMACDIHDWPPFAMIVACLPPRFRSCYNYLLEMSGQLLAVVVPHECIDGDMYVTERSPMKFMIYKIIKKLNEGVYEVICVRNLRAGRLFLSRLSSCAESEVPQNTGPKCLVNCIYLSEDWNTFKTPLIRYRLDNHTVRPLGANGEYPHVWTAWVEFNVGQLYMKLLNSNV